MTSHVCDAKDTFLQLEDSPLFKLSRIKKIDFFYC